MRRQILATSTALALALATLPAAAQDTIVPPAAPEAAAEASSGYSIDPALLAVGAGAVVGIVAFNVLTAPLGTVPLAGAALATVPYDIALGSRLIAAVSGAAGGILASTAYDQWTGEQHDYGYIAALGAGALAGVAVGNLLGGHIGTLPYYAGAGEAAGGAAGFASSAAQAASRIHVIASGVFGAWAADYLYGVSTQ